MTRLITILLAALILEAIGVVLLAHGLRQVGPMERANWAELCRVIRAGATNGWIWTGMLFETGFFIGLLVLISKHDVSLIWPLTSLGFVLTTLAARIIRQEEVTWLRWSGVLLIMTGAMMVGWSDRSRRAPGAEVGKTLAEESAKPTSRDG
ncbi:MAG TPA: hypothetical protein VNO52_16570 [Methylomirabilota bacterium]|nr:hypothetical protein [Methylomirabilota bacterium]